MNLKSLFRTEKARSEALATTYIVTDPHLCVQCGICSYNCPQNIDVRQHAWSGTPIKDSHCLACGECVARCPRGGLHFKTTHLYKDEPKR